MYEGSGAGGTLVQATRWVYFKPVCQGCFYELCLMWLLTLMEGLCCGEGRPAAPQEEQGELLCLRHEVCLEMLGTKGKHVSSSSCLCSAHSPLTPLPGRGRGGFAVVCDWWDARTLWAILPCLLLSAESWLHMSGDFY